MAEVFSGPRCLFTIEGVVVALGRDASASEAWNFESLDVLNSVESLGHEPTGYTAGLRVSQIMLVDETLEALGFAPKKGLSPKEHLKNILTLRELVAQIEDDSESGTGIIVARVFGVRLATRDFSVSARSLVPQELSFVARRIVGASENV